MANVSSESQAAALELMHEYFAREMSQIDKDVAWIQDNVSDPDKREKRLSYQEWKRQQVRSMIAFLGFFE